MTSSFRTLTRTLRTRACREHDRGDLLGESLDEVDMAAADDKPNRIEDDVVGEDRAHVFRVRAGSAHQSFDLEHHALLGVALEIIGADLRVNDEVTHEHPVDLAFGVASADDAASKQPPIDLRRSVRFGPFSRDQIADQRDGLRVDRAFAIVGVTKRSAKSEDVGPHEQQSGNVGGLERARKAAREPRRAAPRAEILEPRDIEMRKETTAKSCPACRASRP